MLHSIEKLRTMNQIELLTYAISSQEAAESVKSSGLFNYVTCTIFLSLRRITLMFREDETTNQFDQFSLDFDKNYFKKTDLLAMELPVVKIRYHRRLEYHRLSEWTDIELLFPEMFKRLMFIFNLDSISLIQFNAWSLINFNLNRFRDVVNAYTRCRLKLKFPYSLDERKMIRRAMEPVKYCIIKENELMDQAHKTFLMSHKYDFIDFEKVTFDGLNNWKYKSVSVRDSNVSDVEIHQFIQNWIHGSYQEMECVQLLFVDRELIPDVILGNISHTRATRRNAIDDGFRISLDILFSEGNGVDIMNDAKEVATVFITNSEDIKEFQIYFWKNIQIY